MYCKSITILNFLFNEKIVIFITTDERMLSLKKIYEFQKGKHSRKQHGPQMSRAMSNIQATVLAGEPVSVKDKGGNIYQVSKRQAFTFRGAVGRKVAGYFSMRGKYFIINHNL